MEARGLVAAADVRATELAGGVSNTVLLVESPVGRWVLKQSLARLKVADEWLAKQERIVTEGRALELAAKLAPGAVPAVIDVDPDAFAIVIEAAPDDWANWKTLLLDGTVDPAVGAGLGWTLSACHAGTAGDGDVAAAFDDTEAFEQLRVDPYYRTIRARVPEVDAPVGALIERMLATRSCLVHGDFSPKNVLTGAGGSWLLDWEVAHTGDPAFDVGFLATHLTLKALHRPGDAAAYGACFEAFLTAYRAGMPLDEVRAVAHLGALLVARTDGKSPAEYLDEPTRSAARELGIRVLRDRPTTFAELWA